METTIAISQPGSYLTSDDSARFNIFDDEVTIKVAGRDTGDAYTVLTIRTAPGGGPPLHAHSGPETFIVISGEFAFTRRGAEGAETVHVGPGTVFHAPGGVPHRFENASAAPSTLMIVSKPEVLDFLRETGEAFPQGSEPNMEKMLALSAKHHINVFYGGDGSRPEPAQDGATSSAARALAWRFAQANDALIGVLERCTPEQWQAICSDTGWTVAVQAHHVAINHAQLAAMFQQVADGESPAPMTPEALDEVNARHAEAFANVSRDETIALMRENGALALEIYRRLSDEQLAQTGTLLIGAPPTAVQGLIEHIAIGEIERHGQAIREAIGVSR